MINGKFYTGLTDQMMSRSRIVNRQETHFFWPDESKMEAVQTRKGARPTNSINNNDRSAKNNNNYMTTSNNLSRIDSPEIKPKELFRKQLSSGIEFFDNVDAKTPESRRRRFKKIDNINLNHSETTPYQPEKKKLETFSSKIEFYDFDDEPIKPLKSDPVKSMKSGPTKMAANSIGTKQINKTDTFKTESEANPRKSESPDVSKKRITFQADAQKSTAEKATKSILKNASVDIDKSSSVESKVVEVKPLHKRGLLPKNLSKSVENLSKMAAVIENDVKAQKSSSNRPETLSAIIKEVKSLNLSTPERRPTPKYDADAVDYDERSDRRHDRGRPLPAEQRREYSPRQNDEYSERRDYRDAEYRDRYDDYDGRDYYDRYEPAPRPRDVYETRRYRESSHRIDDRPVRGGRGAHMDDRGYRPGSYRDDRGDRYSGDSRSSVNSSQRNDRGSAYSTQRDDRSSRYATQRDNRDSGFSTHRDDRYDEHLNRADTSPQYEETLEGYGHVASSQPAKNLPHHLRTNILSNGLPRPQSQRPLSVRNSAVTRVGVGLPDYE